MISPEAFFKKLEAHDISFFAGIPDSLLKDICAYITCSVPPHQHVICANEGAAIALGLGYHLATGKVPFIYLQNSGLGNTINPLLSLADAEVYSIPLLLMLGWRGEPGVKDEPQHVKQGRVMLPMLEAMEIPYNILDNNLEKTSNIIDQTLHDIKRDNRPHALIVRKNTFAEYKFAENNKKTLELSREEAIKCVINKLNTDDIVVSTTGMASREVFECRVERGDSHVCDFLTVGGMGHASQIALGIALQAPERQVFCIDGDGAAIMHLGSFAIIGSRGCKNFKHILINNGAHDSVGGQPTVGFDINFKEIGLAVGYKEVASASNLEELQAGMNILQKSTGPLLLEIKVRTGARKNLGRPSTNPLENKNKFMNFLLSR